jgi:hypothetical protein
VTGPALLACGILALLVLGAALARRRAAPPGAAEELVITGRAHLARDAGLASVRARGEHLLVGWGSDGVRLVARLGRERDP